MKPRLHQDLESAGIRFIRVIFADNVNVIRGKAFHIGMLSHYLEHGVGITPAQQALPVMYDAVVPETGLSPVGEIRLMPDWNTWKPLPYAPGHARAMGDLIKEGQPWSVCPRNFLRRMMAECRQEGFQVRAAFEKEFYLLRSIDGKIIPSDETVFASTLAMDLNYRVIDAIVEALLAQGISVELYHPESGPGQHEITLPHTEAMSAADQQIIFRETVHAVAAQHGLKASFLPKIFEDKAGSGCHLHFSLWQGNKNLLPEAGGKGGLSWKGLAFLAGILEHLPALMALTTPTCNSYRRIRPHFWSGAFRCWGVDNREAAIRVPSSPAGEGATNIELKTLDASANPYLALGAILAAGLDGVRRDMDPGEPLQVDPGNLTETERSARKINPLPTDLNQAIDHLNRNEFLKKALGEDLARAFLALRRAEWDALKDTNLTDEVALLLERY